MWMWECLAEQQRAVPMHIEGQQQEQVQVVGWAPVLAEELVLDQPLSWLVGVILGLMWW